jgi:translation elongation factor P/translation initiation factor 5A
LFILYRKGIILNGKSVRVLEASNSDDGSPSSSNKVVAEDLGSGNGKVFLTIQEADGIIETTDLDLKQHAK